MIEFLKKYKALWIGLLVTIFLGVFLENINFIIINDNVTGELIFFFVFWWLAISFVIYKIPYLIQHRIVVYKIVGLLLILVIAIVIGEYFDMTDNPFTITFITLFWIGVASLVMPQFFAKYRNYILGVYGVIIAYFFFVRFTDDYFNLYKESVLMAIVVPVPVFLLLWIYEQWRWLKTLQSEKRDAELALLKSQINPHFFFNTLNNLYGLTVEKSDKAPEVVLKLSDMMRYTIYEGKEDLVALKDEIAYLENYIELHKMRYHKKVDIVFNQQISGEIKIAPLLFIILLENAFKHGAESLTEDAYIHMNLHATDAEVSFSVSNNFDVSRPAGPSGIGLDNLKNRLELIYPKNHHLSITKETGNYTAKLEISL